MTDALSLNCAPPDVVVIGSGVGGAAVALKRAGSGAKVLLLERGSALKDEPELSDAEAVFVQNRYRTTEIWEDSAGRRCRALVGQPPNPMRMTRLPHVSDM